MARVGDKFIRFNAVEGTNEYHVRLLPAGEPFSYKVEPNLRVAHAPNGENKMLINLKGIQIPDGIYDLHVTAWESKDNESDPLAGAALSVDFTPPAAPTNLEILF